MTVTYLEPRRWSTILLAAAASLLIAHLADADDDRGPSLKVRDGLYQLVQAPIELPQQTIKSTRYAGAEFKGYGERPAMAMGAVSGLWRGVVHGWGRLGLGAYQTAGFWTANPEDNFGVGTRFDGRSALDPSIGPRLSARDEGKRMNAKLQRGIGNIVAGVTEIPYQTRYGIERGETLEGIAKGLWFAPSRILDGAYETVTFFAPSAERTYGKRFEQIYPWRR